MGPGLRLGFEKAVCTLRHRQHAVDVLEVRAAAREGARVRERHREGEQRVVHVDVRARVRGVVPQHGHRVRAQHRSVGDQRREEVRERGEQL